MAKPFRILVFDLQVLDWKGRVRAAKELVQFGEPAVPFLIKALGDEVSHVRNEAAEALGKIGEPAVEPLIGELGEEHPDVRANAAWVLGEIGNSKAFEPLIERLGEEHWRVRNTVHTALGKITPTTQEQIQKILNLFDNGDDDERTVALIVLGKIGNKDRVQEIMKCTKGRVTLAMATNAVEALGNIDDEQCFEWLVKELRVNKIVIRNIAKVLLDKHSDRMDMKDKIYCLVIMKRDTEIMNLGAEAIPILAKIIENNSGKDRDRVFDILKQAAGTTMDISAAYPALSKVLDRNVKDRKRAAIILNTTLLCGQEISETIPALIASLKYSNQDIEDVVTVLRTAAEFGAEVDLKEVGEVFQDFVEGESWKGSGSRKKAENKARGIFARINNGVRSGKKHMKDGMLSDGTIRVPGGKQKRLIRVQRVGTR